MFFFNYNGKCDPLAVFNNLLLLRYFLYQCY